MRVRGGVLTTVLVVAATTAPARADWVATPYLHANFGDVEVRRGGPGVSVGYVGGRLGFELDVDRHFHFFKDADLESVRDPCVPGVASRACVDSDTDAWVVMGNVVASIPVSEAARWRPYVTAGLGAVRAWIDDAGEHDASQTDLAFDLGGGLTYSLGSRVRIRSDARYFHAFVDETRRDGVYFNDYDFWRVTLGVTLLIRARH